MQTPGANPAACPPLRALLLEDDPDFAELLSMWLKPAGISCEAISTAAELETCIASGEFDVVLSDYSLAGWTGMDALEQLRARGSDAPFIVVTGALGDEKAADCLRAGACDYLLKDRLDRLPAAIGNALRLRDAQRQQAEAARALRDSEEKFAIAFQSSPDAITIASLDGELIEVNEQ